MAAEGGIDIPGLPLGKAADQLLSVNPTLGAVIIFETAAIMFLIWWINRLIKSKDDLAESKDKEIAEAKAAHIADLKLNIPAMQELRETILSLVQRGRRAS